MELVHPVSDEWTDDRSVFVASARSVLLTGPLRAFLENAVEGGRRPVLVTARDARVSTLAALAMGRAGASWAVKDPTGVYDALSGYRISQLSDLWGPARIDQGRLPGFGERSTSTVAVAMFEVYAHHRTTGQVHLGGLAELVVTALGGAPLDVWGATEPLTDHWDDAVVTEHIRRTMPDSDVAYARAADGSFVATSAGRTPRGVHQLVKGGVPLGAYTVPKQDVAAAATTMLTRAHDAYLPTVAFVSVAELDAGPSQTASARRPEAPVAALLGPQVVHDLGADLDALRSRHDVTVLGRARTPSVLVRFTEAHRGMWEQLLGFAHDLGLDRIQQTMYLEGR